MVPGSVRCWQACTALRVSTSATASWKDAATSGAWTGSPAAVFAHRATAVFDPGEREVERAIVILAAGKADRDRIALTGRLVDQQAAGEASSSTRATLSYASPAASSMVAPSGMTSCATSGTSSSEELPPETSRAAAGRGQRAVLQLVDGDVGGQVVDPIQRLAQRDGVGLGHGHPDQQRPGQSGPCGDTRWGAAASWR